MKKTLIKIIPLLLGSFALTAQAALITGQINITGVSVTVVPPNVLGAVTAVNAASGTVTAVETSSSYPLSLVGDTVTYGSFAVAVGPQAITNLWTVSDLGVGGTGIGYSFDLTGITTVSQSPFNLFILGTGTLKSTSALLDPTAGTWTYGINSANGTGTGSPPVFSFQANNVGSPVGVTVPEGGDTVILFGLGLIGLAGFSRKFRLAA